MDAPVCGHASAFLPTCVSGCIFTCPVDVSTCGSVHMVGPHACLNACVTVSMHMSMHCIHTCMVPVRATEACIGAEGVIVSIIERHVRAGAQNCDVLLHCCHVVLRLQYSGVGAMLGVQCWGYSAGVTVLRAQCCGHSAAGTVLRAQC